MKYQKSPLTFEKQADLLLKRGLLAGKSELIDILSTINYYRLSAYWKQFQDKTENFYEHTHINNIMYYYMFDEELRNIIFYAIAQIEVYLKTTFANVTSLVYNDSFFYLDKEKLPGIDNETFFKIINKIKISCESSKEIYLKHFKNKYGDSHEYPPIWMLIELISFGTFSKLFCSIENKVGKEVSRSFGINYYIMRSWVWSLNEVRNICAHHSRLWNRTLGNKPLTPKEENLKEWYKPSKIGNEKVFSIIFILLTICYKSNLNIKWFKQIINLINLYPNIQLQEMGFIEDWQKNPTINKALKEYYEPIH